MTKDAEIALLDVVIKQYGPNSYVGPWLSEHRDSIAADIKNDLVIGAAGPKTARLEAAKIIEAAKTEAKALLLKSETTAADTIRAANEYARKTRTDLRRDVEALIRRTAEAL